MMRTRVNEESHYSPQPRRPIHHPKMEQHGVNPGNYQNLKYGREDTLSDYTDTDDDYSDPLEDSDDRKRLGTNVDQETSGWKSGLGKSTNVDQEPNGWKSGLGKSTTGSPHYKMKPEKCGIPPSIATEQTGQLFIKHILKAAAMLVVAAVIYYCSNGEAEDKVLPPLSVTGQESLRERSLRSDIKHIRDEFPSQHKSIWKKFSAGIKMVQEDPTKPSVFLLLHETEEGTPACLAKKIGRIASQFLNATNRLPLVLEGADLKRNETLVEDYGTLIDEYRPKVEEQRTMIVYNLHKIPGIVAQSFHSFCDTITPLVDKAVYLFTMKTSGVNHAGNNPTKLAEEELKKLWDGELDKDILMPLIVRITDSAMSIMPERNLKSCE